MPYINKPPKKGNKRNEHTTPRELRQKYYNTTEWKKLRLLYLKEHPLCEECLNEGRVTTAEDIHHKNSPFKNGECNKNLFLDYNNLMALCKLCHNKKHNPNQGPKVEDVIKQLADLLNPKISDKELEDGD
jgi:5-methylcytosine-specific restriction protein A